MNILVSNDDGYSSLGIIALAKQMAKIGKVQVVAPEGNRSASSSAMTLYSPLMKNTDERGHIYLNGTPADCVHAAITGILNPVPDIVVSGVNNGANLGGDVLYSGTLGAAIEGRNLKYAAVAVSVCSKQPQHYQSAAIMAAKIVKKITTANLPPRTVLNVNVPDLPLEKIKGIRITRAGLRHEANPVIKDTDPRGREVYWVGAPGAVFDGEKGTDFHAISQGYVSVTPILVDLSDYALIEKMQHWNS